MVEEYTYTATTVGRLGGVTVSLSGVYTADVPGHGRQRVVDLVIGGATRLDGVHAGQEFEANGTRWRVTAVRKRWRKKGQVTFQGPLEAGN